MFDNWSTLKKLIWNRAFSGGTGPEYKTKSGAVVHITDALAAPIKKLVAPLAPVQDLHGYDIPWPAGGGKNKFDVDSATVYRRFVNATDNVWRASSDSRSYAFPCIPNTTYTISCTGNEISIFRTGYITESTIPQTGDIVIYSIDSKTEAGSRTITTGEDATFIIIQLNAAIIDNKSGYLQIELGSTATAYAPYSNECPISGWDGCTARRTGKNILRYRSDIGLPKTNNGITYEWSADGGITASGVATSLSFLNLTVSSQSNTYPVKPGKKYFFSSSVNSGVYIQLFVNGISSGYGYGFSYTMPEELTNWYVRLRVSDGVDLTTPVTAYPFICLDEEIDKTYEPFTEETISVSWQSTAGTVYGGSMTVYEDGSGELVVDKKLISFDGTESGWSMVTSGGQRYYRTKPSDASTASQVSLQTTSSVFGDIRGMGNNGKLGVLVVGGDLFKILDSGAELVNLAGFKNWLADLNSAGTPLQIVYPLATPQTYTFENLEQLTTLLGTNNIWVDTGDVEVTYLANSRVSNADAMNHLLGGMYTPGDVSDSEALNILLGGKT